MASFLPPLGCWPGQRRKTLLKDQAGILVTEGLNVAIERCRDKVKRDLEFDLLEDRDRCLYRLGYDASNPKYTPADVRRIPDIVEKPQFVVDGATAGDICQGALGNCWQAGGHHLRAQIHLTDLVLQQRDEDMGIYGFIFWRDSGWAEVIVDDLVFTKVRPWEALSSGEREVYRNDRRTYDNTARRGLFTNLYFAKSRTNNETWVPLIEKAYAKLHGDYESLEGGFTSEGVEDLTGGVSTLIYRGDIPSVDDFWDEELSKVGKTRLFACFTPGSTPGGADLDLQPLGAIEIEGLLTNHAYSITKAIKFTGRDGVYRGRFLRIRNPWGRKEWSGRWSDGSEEWNDKWTEELREALGNYRFGDDGEFVQEYSDFLDCWGIIERSRLFGDGWIMSSQWLQMPPDTHLRPWSLGEVSFTIDITGPIGAEGPSETIIVLAQRDTRYFRELAGPYRWSLDFLLYVRGKDLPIARSVHSTMWDRSVKLEIDLPPGQYVVHARLDCKRKTLDTSPAPGDWRKRHRKQMEQTASAMVAANCNHALLPFQYLSVPAVAFAGRDLNEIELQLNYETLETRIRSQQLSDSPAQRSPELKAHAPNAPVSDSEQTPIDSQSNYGTSISDGLSPITTRVASSASSLRDRRIPSPAQPQPERAMHQRFVDSPPQTLHEFHTPTLTKEARKSSKPRPVPGRWPTLQSERTASSMLVSPGENDDTVPSPVNSFLWEDVAKKKLDYAKTDNQKYKHEGFLCKECQHAIIGPMIRCLEVMCHGCHLCIRCMEHSLVHQDHKFIVCTSAEDDKALTPQYQTNAACDPLHECGTQAVEKDVQPASDLVLGLRVYTRKPAQATVKGQLRTGSILRSHYFTPNPLEDRSETWIHIIFLTQSS